jgi:hypothetical protein
MIDCNGDYASMKEPKPITIPKEVAARCTNPDGFERFDAGGEQGVVRSPRRIPQARGGAQKAVDGEPKLAWPEAEICTKSIAHLNMPNLYIH